MSIFELAKSKGYLGENNVSLLSDWIRNKYNLHSEIFFSFYHGQWYINNYTIDLKKKKKIERELKVHHFDSYELALTKAVDEMLNLIK